MSKKVLPEIFFELEPVSQPNGQCDCADCDCACSLITDRLIPLQTLSTHTLLVRNILSVQKPLNDQYSIFFGPNHHPSVLNNAAQTSLSWFNKQRSVKEAKTKFAYSKELLQKFIASNLVVADTSYPSFHESPHNLSAWLHITDRCNLRCAYCYLPHHKQDMTPEVGRASIDATIRSALVNGMEQVKLKYAGGEALLLWPLVEELHPYAIQQAEAHNLKLDAVVLSNGTLLTDEIAQRMRQLNLRLMISLDGLGEIHDAHRPYAGGRGTFKDVEQGIEIALANNLIPDISITISGKNAHGLAELVAWVLEKELPFSLNFYRENELSATHEELQLEEQKIIHGMLTAYRVIEQNLPRRSLLGSLVDRANLSAPHLRTCSVGENYLVFDYRGNVGKCQMELFKSVARATDEDPLKLIREDKIGIQNISVEEKEGCRDCEWKYWCTGGCSLATYRATGRYDVKSPNCNIYKALYPEAMRLEGLRLLKYHNKA